MTHINELNERTRHEDMRNQHAALLIAVFSLPMAYRQKVLAYAGRNYKRISQGMEPEYEAIEWQDTQEADYERGERERRESEHYDHPKE